MKKYIIGGLIGFVLATAASANAQGVTKVIGEVIDGAFSVKVNGVELTDQAIVVQGTSYLPVRAFGDATGYDIKFNPELGIELTKKIDTPTTPVETPVVTPQPTPVAGKTVVEQISDLQKKLEDVKLSLKTGKQLKKVNEDSLIDPNVPKDEVKKIIDELSAGIADNEKRITDYEAQITALEAQK